MSALTADAANALRWAQMAGITPAERRVMPHVIPIDREV